MRAKNIIHTSILGAAAITTTANGTGVDISAFEGDVKFTLDSSAGGGADHTLDVTLEHSDDDVTYTAVTGGAFTQVTDVAGTAGVQVLKINVPDLKRYLRVVSTIAGTTPSFDFGVEFVGIKKAS